MVPSFRLFFKALYAAQRFALVAMFALGAAFQANGQSTHLWTQSRFEDFEKGTPDGVSISSDGRLHEGPALREKLTTPSTFVWSVAADKNGTTWIGTGSPATVLRLDNSGKPFTLFDTKDLSVQVVRLSPDGQLYAATVPSGKVYRIDSNAMTRQDDQKATVVFDAAKLDSAKSSVAADSTAKSNGSGSEDKADAKSRYIWDMAFDQAGRLYIATGAPAAVYRVDPAKPGDKPELFFKSDEQHIRSLAWDGKGNLVAGSDGSGLVYRISPEGKGYVLFAAPHREITSVAVGSDGTIYAASVGDKSRNPLPPLPVQGVGTVSITIVQPGSLQAANASTSLPEGTEIFALREGQAARKIWSGKDDVVYALAAQPVGLLALSGNRGRIFRIQPDGDYADVAHLEAQQGLSLAMQGNADVLIGTGNTGKLVALAATEKHEYASDVMDAGALARFGRVEVEPGSTGYQLWTRSGNVEQPVRGWSDWAQLKDGVAASPAGRFMQWKVVLDNSGNVGGVGVNYLPVNAAPIVDDIVVVPGARVNSQSQQAAQQTVTISLPSANQGSPASFDAAASAPLPAMKDRSAIAVRWAAHDDNGDDLTYTLYIRGDGERVWRVLKSDVTEKAYSFDATLIPDGGYQIKVVASDAPSHTPGDSLTGAKISERFEVDTTPPIVRSLTATEEPAPCAQGSCPKPVRVTFEAEDAQSPIAHAEYSVDAGPWKFIAPVGELSDSKHERYELRLPASAFDGKTGEHLLTVRVYDRYENVGVAKTVFGSESK
jgi:sugar lactone lactonase YvrE